MVGGWQGAEEDEGFGVMLLLKEERCGMGREKLGTKCRSQVLNFVLNLGDLVNEASIAGEWDKR